MTNKEASVKLQNMINWFLENYLDYAGVREAFDKAIIALEMSEPQWIPCSERYPDMDH